jgi:hypothetical protein
MAEPAAQKKLGEYLLQLVMYPAELDRFKADPKTAVAESGLSPDNQKLLLAGKLNDILDELAREYVLPPGDHFLKPPPGP